MNQLTLPQTRTCTLAGIVPPGVDLSKHLNEQVEVVGPIIEPPAGEKKDPKIEMYQFKSIAPKCS